MVVRLTAVVIVMVGMTWFWWRRLASSRASSHRIVLVTTESSEQAQAIAQAVVQAQLAACVNILPGVTSVYSWKGEIERAQEHLLIVRMHVSAT
jgi:hypothetical protein